MAARSTVGAIDISPGVSPGKAPTNQPRQGRQPSCLNRRLPKPSFLVYCTMVITSRSD